MTLAILLTLSCFCCFPSPDGESSGQLASDLSWQIEEVQASKMTPPRRYDLTLEISAGERGDSDGDGRAVIASEVARRHLLDSFQRGIDSPQTAAEIGDDKTSIHISFPPGALEEVLFAIASLIDGRELPQTPIATGQLPTSSLIAARRALIDALDPLPSLAPRGGDPYLRARLTWQEVDRWRRSWHRPCRTLLRFRGPIARTVLLDSMVPILGSLDPGKPLAMPTRRPLPATAIPFPPRLEENQDPFLLCGWRLPAGGKVPGALVQKFLEELPPVPPPWPDHWMHPDSSPRVLILIEPIIHGEEPAQARKRLVARLSHAVAGLDRSSAQFDSPGFQHLKRSLAPARGLSIAVQRRIPLEQNRF